MRSQQSTGSIGTSLTLKIVGHEKLSSVGIFVQPARKKERDRSQSGQKLLSSSELTSPITQVLGCIVTWCSVNQAVPDLGNAVLLLYIDIPYSVLSLVQIGWVYSLFHTKLS